MSNLTGSDNLTTDIMVGLEGLPAINAAASVFTQQMTDLFDQAELQGVFNGLKTGKLTLGDALKSMAHKTTDLALAVMEQERLVMAQESALYELYESVSREAAEMSKEASSDGYELTGKVLNQKSEPLTGIRVEVVTVNPNNPVVVGFGTTDNKGQFHITVKAYHFPAGEHSVDLFVHVGLAPMQALYVHESAISLKPQIMSQLTIKVPERQAVDILATQGKLAALSALGADNLYRRKMINEVIFTQIETLAQRLMGEANKKQAALEKDK